eukprot:TRINITY_DN741_c0_g1_i3.p2 TRINITY_DN741_c0_g1~~TRINITY_DN741_c0_g1_i3.p2  ORF type:complete len:330 (+),score=175.44 TRINITY_DN741_c0_g1_i3:44-1033(+)
MGGRKIVHGKRCGFVKVQKNNAYFKRYQVKYRRRREGKTDYQQRRILITQDKNKYQTPKYRLVARITNRDVIAQVASAELKGDRIHASAYAHQLKDFGCKAGFSNYAAAYATGLLVARRILTLKGLAKKYPGVAECTGEHFEPEEQEDQRPFKCNLDIGLATPSVGAKVFAVMKGAVDGGLLVPHSDKRFAGYAPDSGELDAEVLRSRIFGEHVQEWMDEMEEEDNDKFKAHFSRYLEVGVDAESIPEMWEEVHKNIRADPKAVCPTKNTAARKAKAAAAAKPRSYRLKAQTAYTLSQRQHRATQKLNALRRKLGYEDRATAAPGYKQQ